jgi:hypothetical protein
MNTLGSDFEAQIFMSIWYKDETDITDIIRSGVSYIPYLIQEENDNLIFTCCGDCVLKIQLVYKRKG